MLKVTIDALDSYDEDRQVFVTSEAVELSLEHSLASMSKWESIWEKPFLTSDEKTLDETLSYLKCMTLTPDIPDSVYTRVNQATLDIVNNYIAAKMTATWFKETKGGTSRQIITSELIYSWMVSYRIPFEAETWHVNRLITLVKIMNEQNAPKKKMSRAELAERNRALNAERRQKIGTAG